MLAIDVGNSNIVVGLFEDGELRTSWRFATDRDRMPDEWWALLSRLAEVEQVELTRVSGAIISSVVPRLTPKLLEMLEQRIGVRSHVVSTDLDLGIGVETDHPEEVGADRIVNSAAVRERYWTPAVVVDFGTATTFDVISAEGNYVGGAIAPGVQLALDALTGRAARLSSIEVTVPKHAIGRNTGHSVQSGTVLGYVELVNGMLDRISRELAGEPAIVATGGLGALFQEHCPLIQAYEPDLTLYGLQIVYQHLTRT